PRQTDRLRPESAPAFPGAMSGETRIAAPRRSRGVSAWKRQGRQTGEYGIEKHRSASRSRPGRDLPPSHQPPPTPGRVRQAEAAETPQLAVAADSSWTSR